MDYSAIGGFVVDVLQSALPVRFDFCNNGKTCTDVFPLCFYSIMLTQIINNQTEILELMQDTCDFLGVLSLMLAIFLTYIFIRNLISSK